jgi:competence protein ComGC
MRVAILQILMIADMIKVEFKISEPNGHNAYVEKMINSMEEYEQFKLEVSTSIASLDSIITQKLKRLTNGTSTNRGNHLQKA